MLSVDNGELYVSKVRNCNIDRGTGTLHWRLVVPSGTTNNDDYHIMSEHVQNGMPWVSSVMAQFR
jgi:hypothetical protein